MLLLAIGINILLSGDLIMGLATLSASLFFITLMIRHFIRVKKERGRLNAKDCLRCNQSFPELKDKELL